MSKDVYAVALESALTEIEKTCPDVSCSFIFTRDGTIVAQDSKANEERMKKTLRSFQSIAEKANGIGELQALLVNGEEGNVHLFLINDMYITLVASKNANMTFLHSVARVIFPTVLKLLESITPTPLHTPSKQLIVDTLSGFFVGDSVQIDLQILEQWSQLLNGKSVDEVEIEAIDGKTAQCKVKEINDSKLQGKGIIRVPEKICKTLEVENGELVKVKPTQLGET